MKRVRALLHLDDYAQLRHRPCDFSIAILDSGVAEHPDIASNIIAFHDVVGKKKTPYDDYGHGTHIAGIICGDGRLSNGAYEGVIPSAKIIAIKILDGKGDGASAHLLDALDWVYQNRERYRIRIVNISIGMENHVSSDKRKRMRQAISRLYEEDILVITAAGNNGPQPMTLSALGEGDDVISVGCYDFGYRGQSGRSCSEYSARGPSRYSLKKPDLVAPGTDIVSCSHRYRQGRRNAYCIKSGTSMATAVVTGASAMLLANGYLSSKQLIARLQHAARDVNEPWNLQGWGVLDIERLLS